MKKILMVILLGMVAFFAQSTMAATVLSLSTISGGNGNTLSILTNNDDSVSGTSSLKNTGAFTDKWGISSTPTSQASVVTVENRDVNVLISSVVLKDALNNILASSVQSPSGTWTMSYLLVSGTNYVIEIIGNTLARNQTYTLTANTPIPAAIWLFGSALMGLVGASRRKLGSAA